MTSEVESPAYFESSDDEEDIPEAIRLARLKAKRYQVTISCFSQYLRSINNVSNSFNHMIYIQKRFTHIALRNVGQYQPIACTTIKAL